MPTKVLTDPQELDRALATGLQAVSNGFTFDPQTGPFPEAYQVSIMPLKKYILILYINTAGQNI